MQVIIRKQQWQPVRTASILRTHLQLCLIFNIQMVGVVLEEIVVKRL